jgi:diaminohydroxyphosphoribosylaminopyrimidine deaminase/5-amino-6-(5-phosphoribosylamino)uracil reductase
MRHGADAVLTGIGTVLADDPLLTDRSGMVGPGGRARRRPLLRVVLDSRLRTPMDSQLVRTANGDVLVLSGAEVATERVAALEAAGVQVERVAEQGGRLGWLDLAAVLDLLGERKISSLLLECGSELNGAFLAEGLVDKVVLFYSQTELGEGAVPFAAGVGTPFVLEQVMGQLTRSVFGADTSVSGYLRDPWDVIESRIPS